MNSDTPVYSEQDVRDFYESWDHKDDRGCYSIDVVKWNTMLVQHPNLCCELETIRLLNRHEKNTTSLKNKLKDS